MELLLTRTSAHNSDISRGNYRSTNTISRLAIELRDLSSSLVDIWSDGSCIRDLSGAWSLFRFTASTLARGCAMFRSANSASISGHGRQDRAVTPDPATAGELP